MSLEVVNIKNPSRLCNFHITFFAIALGMAGFTLAVQKASSLLTWLHPISTIFLYISITCFSLISILYLAKGILCPGSIQKELDHPIKINFFPLIAKTLLVISIILIERNLTASLSFWTLGVILQFIASIYIISSWIQHDHYKIEHMTPGWFIPIVGCTIIPIAGVSYGYYELSWFFFSVGLVFWLLLMSIVLYRIFFHAPIAERLMPTLFILFAPPAIGFIAYMKLYGGELDAFGRILYYFSLFAFLLVIYQLPRLLRLNFFLSWWAYSFPLAAKVLSSFLMMNLTKSPFISFIAWFELVLLAIVIVVLSFRTITAIFKQELCVAD